MVVAVDELEVLRDELDVDQAAGRLLQVPGPLAALLGRDHARASRGRRRAIFFAGRASRESALPISQSIFDAIALVAGDRPRAGERHVLPGPGFLRLVGGEGVDVSGERPGLAGRPQAEIDLVERPLGRRRRQRREQPLGEAREILRRRAAAARRRMPRPARRSRRGRSGRGRTRRSSRGRRACPSRAPRPRPAYRAVRALELAPHRVEQRRDHDLGEVGEGGAGRRARRWCRRARGRRSGRPAPGRRCGRDRAHPRSRRPRRAIARARSASIVRSGTRPKKAGSISASSTCGRWTTVSASRGAVAIIVASSPSRPGLELSMEKSWTPAGSRARKRSKAAKAASAFFVVASASISAGTNSVRRSRAVAERIAG